MSIADELQKLQELHQTGAISDEEYAAAKARMLGPSPNQPNVMRDPADAEQQTRQWAMILHLSQLANCLAPPAGLIAPIVIWQIKKTEMPEIDAHGKIVVNWIISAMIYAAVLTVLMFLIRVPLLMALVVVAIVFPIIGGIKANNGELWKYPLSIEFLK